MFSKDALVGPDWRGTFSTDVARACRDVFLLVSEASGFLNLLGVLRVLGFSHGSPSECTQAFVVRGVYTSTSAQPAGNVGPK